MTDQRQTRDRREEEASTGPFHTPEVHGRLWEPTELERGPFDRRTAADRRSSDPESSSDDEGGAESSERRRRWGRRKSDVLSTEGRRRVSESGMSLMQRLQKPLIGLTLAGVAAPLVNAGVNPAYQPTEPAVDGEPSKGGAQALAGARDLDEEVADRWAEAEEVSVRESTIEGAMTRWDIGQALAQKIYDYATKHDIEPDIAYGLVFTESTFRLRAVSHVGARGLTQLMPRTAKWLDSSVSTQDLYDPDVNLDLGFRYLRQLIDKYNGDLENALTAYNRGPGTVDKILRRGGNPDNGYAGKVFAG